MKRMLHLALLGLTLFAAADAATIRQRQRAQGARIAQGVRSGELTRTEARRLVRSEARLQRGIRRDRIDGGGLSARERVRIDRQQDRLSRRIYREKHDRQDR